MIKLCSSSKKIFNKEDCLLINKDTCLKNETYCFQIFVEKDKDKEYEVKINSNLKTTVYFVDKGKVDRYRDEVQDDYYVRQADDLYPDLLTKCNFFKTDSKGCATLFVEIPADGKQSGQYEIQIDIDGEVASFQLLISNDKLVENDLLLTNWIHMDGICHYYGVNFWSDEFINKLDFFLQAYVKMGNNMILVPTITPALDTEVGGERLTTQLVSITKKEENYFFDFTKLEQFVDICHKHGIKYFEFAHLFTQWGGECCPKIMVNINGEEVQEFGWHIKSTDAKYFNFLKQYLQALVDFLAKKDIKKNSFFHITDEPEIKDLEKYVEVASFVRKQAEGIPILDALSNFTFMKHNVMDLPVVSLKSKDLSEFLQQDNMVYYCVGVDCEYITNRYWDMPLQRVEILGFLLYLLGTKGFLHWGFNFYNAQFSKHSINPYENATAGGGFPAGDSFILYPGVSDVDYSLRYFSMIKAFEDYRLLKTLEKNMGRKAVLAMLNDENVLDVRNYPRSAEWHTEFRRKLRTLIEKSI
ncbi:MAG: DUF4091 domain-containing protein [Clostridia bacterium]|nr:DUF4091 domain-containing protein [Clostridia bacterium]